MRIVTSEGVRGHSLSSQCQQGTGRQILPRFCRQKPFQSFLKLDQCMVVA